jgi:hypothetical protein
MNWEEKMANDHEIVHAKEIARFDSANTQFHATHRLAEYPLCENGGVG